MKRITTACVGTGYFSQFHYDAWRRIPEVELVASVSLDIEQARNTGLVPFEDTAEMLQQVAPYIVDLITPPETHLDLIKKCALSGARTIICQKPFCRSIGEAEEAVKICDQHDVALIVHENFRFQPWYRVMKNALDSNLLGDVHQMTFRLRTGDGQGPRAYLDRQPYFQKMEKFLVRETGVHWIDTFCFLFGQPRSVYADLRKLNPAIAGEDAGIFVMEFDHGKRAVFDANRHLDHDAENCRTTLGEALLEGTKATISLSGNGEVRLRKFGSREYQILLPAGNWPGFGGDCVHALQSHVVESIKSGGQFENSAKDYLRVLELEAAIYQSAEAGQKVLL
ncbi:MAG: Gfo/Idh/MocA family oxidoreductase [Pseudomonadota bacterium]